ncbi:glycosyltransferase, partial [Patescibacteria group bacterium]|nr:glycosyltransferase [Patescibacteria group bacterium]
MKILMISTAIFPVSPENRYAGIETLVRLIINELNDRGHIVTLAAPQGSRLPKGIEHINTGSCGDFVESERKAYWIYSRRLQEFEAILDFSHSHWCMMENDLPAIAFIWHDPYIMKPQEPGYNICALSQWQANRFQLIYGYEARVVDPHCGHSGELKPAKGSFLFLGKMGPQKGCLEAIDICHELGVPLDIIGGPGPGDPPEYLERVKASCHSGVVYQGEVDDSTKIAFLEEARALIYPINYPPGQGEAHSHKIVDTLLCGCPVVTYNTGAFPEIIEHGKTGFLANDREGFKQLMAKVDTLDRQLIREKAIERWSVEATVDRLLEVVIDVTRGLRWGAIASPISKASVPSAVGYLEYEMTEYPRQVRLDTINR